MNTTLSNATPPSVVDNILNAESRSEESPYAESVAHLTPLRRVTSVLSEFSNGSNGIYGCSSISP